MLITLVMSQLLVNIWMFYAKATNCCAELRLILDSGPDGGECPPAGPCRGFAGTCGQLATQFATVPVLPDFPNDLQDWACHQFPDDAYVTDSMIVGLSARPAACPAAQHMLTPFSLRP